MLKIGSLFSGIGGLELGLEWAGLGPVIWQVESEPFCREVLARHWPEAKRYEDVRRVGADEFEPVDLVCGGFPCQDVSSAGARKGLAGERSGLWREFARVLSELRPPWVVVENVASGGRLWVDAVVRELDLLGYGCLPVPLSARDVGALHLRQRVFIVAHADGAELRQQSGRSSGENWKPASLALNAREAGARGHADGEPACAKHDEVAGLSGIATDTDREFGGTWQSGPRSECTGRPVVGGTTTANANEPGRPRTGTDAHEGRLRPSWSGGGAPQPEVCRVADGVSRGLGSARQQLRALGNAVVPQCAEVVGWVIRDLQERME